MFHVSGTKHSIQSTIYTMNTPKTVGFKTLGCRLNQYETDALASKFARLGFKVVEDSKNTDVYIVNTCTVTNQSDQKSRYVVNHALKHGHTGMLIITGCMANHHKEQLEAKYPNAYVVDNKEKVRSLNWYRPISMQKSFPPISNKVVYLHTDRLRKHFTPVAW